MNLDKNLEGDRLHPDKKTFFKKMDILIILCVLAAAGAISLFFYQRSLGKAPKAEIYYGSTLVKTIELDQGIDKTFTVPEDENVVFHLYADGSICFESSDCPDKVCVRTGRLNTVGQSAACLPNKLILKIVPKNVHNSEDLDIIVN